MKKIFFITTFIFIFGFALPTFSFAQSQQQEEQVGKKLLEELNNKTVICSKLKDADFEKIGEYFMGQSIGDTSRHIAMNEMMKRMMGEQSEEQMHTVMGKRLSGCSTIGSIPMMGWGGGGYSMMNNGWGFFDGLMWILVVVFLMLGIIYFWKEINRKK